MGVQSVRSVKPLAPARPSVAPRQIVKRPGIGDCFDVPPVLWTEFVGIGHAPETEENPKCHVRTHPSYAVALSI